MKILVAVDGSEHALDAVRFALRLHQAGLNASFVLATVQEQTYLYEMMIAPNSDVLERISGAAGSRALAGAQALFDSAGVAYTREIGSGEPAPVLIELAQIHGCDAIVLGARGLGALRRALIGSVSQGVLNGSSLPVTIVKKIVASSPVP